MSNRNECDLTVVVGALVVFALPLTLLIPGFSVWNLVPKVSISRFHVLSWDVTWPQLNAVVTGVLVILFCLNLEIRKRKLDDMVEKVLTVSQATDIAMEVERDRQSSTMKACVELLDASTEHYEHLVLLRDELRKREKIKQVRQQPPTIELSSTEFI